MKTHQLDAKHGIVCHLPDDKRGYFGWPTVARLESGRLIVAASGCRSHHPCPWGETTINISDDDGATWSERRTIHSSPLDDRDAGVVDLGGGTILVSWASVDVREQVKDPKSAAAFQDMVGMEEWESWCPTLESLTDEEVAAHSGAWIMLSHDNGETWGEKVRTPVYSPHGPIRSRDGDLIYFGKTFIESKMELHYSPVVCYRSSDNGVTWKQVGEVPPAPTTLHENFCEPDIVELASGKLIGMVRCSGFSTGNGGMLNFSMAQSESMDGGRTWTPLRLLNFPGAPPQIIQHSSGAVILAYGYRLIPWSQRIAISRDEGANWECRWLLRDDVPDWDLGYPSTVELGDGSLFTVYYQKVPGNSRCSLISSRWQLPDGDSYR